MKRFILLTFAVLFWGYYELSGGSDFTPGAPQRAGQGTAGGPEAREDSEAETVARTATGDILTRVAVPAVAEDAQSSSGVQTAVPAPPSVQDSEAAPVREAPEPAPITGGAPASVPDPAGSQRDIRAVAADRVNLRAGPGTGHEVLAQLPRDAAVEVLRRDAGGWLEVRDLGTDRVGWMAGFLVGAPE